MTTRPLKLMLALALLAASAPARAGSPEELTVLSYHEVADPAQAL